MKISREELLRQRDLVARHLEWIEEQLSVQESAQAEDPTPKELLQKESGLQETAESQAPLPLPSESPSAKDEDAASILEQYGTSPNSSVTQMKMGCILLAVLAGGAILFFFLVLPYLITG